MSILKDLIDKSMSENNWTQTEIAEKVGVSQPLINKIVNQSNIAPSLDTIKKFSAFFNMSRFNPARAYHLQSIEALRFIPRASCFFRTVLNTSLRHE